MTSGALSKAEMQAWALNRYCYQAVIPRKDAMILAHAEDPAFRAAWEALSHHFDATELEAWAGVVLTLAALFFGAFTLLFGTSAYGNCLSR